MMTKILIIIKIVAILFGVIFSGVLISLLIHPNQKSFISYDEFNIGDILSDSYVHLNLFKTKYNYIIIIDKRLDNYGNWSYSYQYCNKLGEPVIDKVYSGQIDSYNKKVN